jgi:maltose alpha-D-glucosyltransferase/alpha-amylase
MTAARAKGTPRAIARAAAWQTQGEAELLDAYAVKTRGASFLPSRAEDMRALLDFYVLEKCVYEVHYEMNNRPDWITIPLAGLLQRTDSMGARDAES